TGRICDPSSNCSGSYPYTCCGYPKLGCGNPGTATPAIGEVGGGGGCCNYSALITHVCHIIGNKVDEWQCPPCTNGQTQSCYSGASETKGIGECRAGTQTCTNGQWGACVGEILPSTEVCGNNTDENCDGNIDEGCAVCEDKDGDGYYAYNPVSCSQGNDCNDNDASINPGAKEKCDGIDNNCDGQKDETCLGNQCGEMKRTDEKGQMKRGQATFRVGMDIENAERS
ncbi:MAG: putative metal-binding motif-containing protein, partial [Nitrospirae bacterium]|nr:putative metal-binding motif-containing protein [Nitrospirota bacterium]